MQALLCDVIQLCPDICKVSLLYSSTTGRHMNSGKGKVNLTIFPLPAVPVVQIPSINQNLPVNQAFRHKILNPSLNCTFPFHPQFQRSEHGSIDPLRSCQIRSDGATARINLSIHPSIILLFLIILSSTIYSTT